MKVLSRTDKLVLACPLSVWDGTHGNCHWCNKELPRNRDGSIHKTMAWCNVVCKNAYGNNHFWTWARTEAIKRDKKRCVRCGAGVGVRLEVNHKVPILGRHAETGCHHHLDELETLCRSCHLAETAKQFGYKPKQRPTTAQGRFFCG